ncbi:hypothetical protein, partial [Methanolobus psychrotolerans]|uniref:hypothetical protein n=1 Tax=Methanolobus psychrotolerans TaxID=1874706 RepID=UPI001A938D50
MCLKISKTSSISERKLYHRYVSYVIHNEELIHMTAIVYQTDNRSGITYAYESVSYWDKEK